MRKILALLLCSVSFLSFSQTDSSKADSLLIRKLLLLKDTRPIVGLEFNTGVANNQINFNSIWDFANSSFLNNDFKESIVSDISGSTSIGYWQSYQFSWDKPGYWVLGIYIPGKKFSIRNDYYLSTNSPKEAIELALFGNKRFAGNTFSLADAAYESWWYTSFDYEYDFEADSIHYNVGGALVIGHEYEKYTVEKADFFTDPNGEFLDADLNYKLDRTDDPNTIPLNGIGLSGNFAITVPSRSKYYLHFALKDLGFIYWRNVQTTEVDSSFRFNGLTFDNIFEITDSLRDSETDKLTNGLYSDENNERLRLLPFYVHLKGGLKIKKKMLKEVYAHVDYRYLIGYSPRFGVGTDWKFKENHDLTTELNYGGFNTLALRAQYKIRLWDKYQLLLATNNILAPALPGLSTGTSIHLGLFYTL